MVYADKIQAVEDFIASFSGDYLSELMQRIDMMEPRDILAVMTLVVVFSLLSYSLGYKHGRDGKFKFGYVSVQVLLVIIIWISECFFLGAAV